jgi:hypothetical protein
MDAEFVDLELIEGAAYNADQGTTPLNRQRRFPFGKVRSVF